MLVLPICVVLQAAWLQEFARKCKDISRVFRWVCMSGAQGQSLCLLLLLLVYSSGQQHAHLCGQLIVLSAISEGLAS